MPSRVTGPSIRLPQTGGQAAQVGPAIRCVGPPQGLRTGLAGAAQGPNDQRGDSSHKSQSFDPDRVALEADCGNAAMMSPERAPRFALSDEMRCLQAAGSCRRNRFTASAKEPAGRASRGCGPLGQSQSCTSRTYLHLRPAVSTTGGAGCSSATREMPYPSTCQ
jgi:hypothetical protein